MTVYANMLETNYECGGLAKIGVVSRAFFSLC